MNSKVSVKDHPLRYSLANEIHARPSPSLKSPFQAAYLVFKREHNAASRDRRVDLEQLNALLDHYAAPHPQTGATHYFGPIGNYELKWESHTEFVSYTIFDRDGETRPFDVKTFELFPLDWLSSSPYVRVTSALISVERLNDDEIIAKKIDESFVRSSVAVSRVLNNEAVIAGDFRIDPTGHMRFAIFTSLNIGKGRTGRIVQRLCEIETYKALSMLGFARCRKLNEALASIDRRLSKLSTALSGDTDDTVSSLNSLLRISGELEALTAEASFRFGATAAYEKIVNQRIKVLREGRFAGRQIFAEFMMRRFNPAMNTVSSTQDRLGAMTGRAIRASNLLQTRVDVERSAENRALLESMNRRAALQLRLQKTVEGLSVVAISYYAVNLAANVTLPFAKHYNVTDYLLKAMLTPFVIFAVWLMLRNVHKSLKSLRF